MIQANQIIDDALALIDVQAVGESAERDWGKLGVRLLNALLSDWATRGLYNPELVTAEFTPKSPISSFTIGYDDDVKGIGNTLFDITDTQDDINGTFYKTVNGDVISYSTTGSGSKYILTINSSTTGEFVKTNTGYSMRAVGDIPVQFAHIERIQVDNGVVTYNPQQITVGEYQSLSVKQSQSAPQYWCSDFQFPFTKINFYPTLLTGYKVRVIGQPTFDEITSPQSKVKISRHYYDAILYNLALKLYPFQKRESGIDQSIVIQAKGAMEGLRSRSIAMEMPKVKCAYAGASQGSSSFWTSALNSAPMVGN